MSIMLPFAFVKQRNVSCDCQQHFVDKRTSSWRSAWLCPMAYFVSPIRHLLSIDTTKTLLSAFVLQKLDYYNPIFYGSPMYLLERLQKVQNSAARQNYISPHLMFLHWLPINARIEYKLSVICNFFFLGLSPIYLSDLLLVYTPKRNLRSSPDNRITCIPNLRTKTFGQHSFSFAAPTIWNSLPSELRHIDSIQKFKIAPKTHFLRKCMIHQLFC